MNNLTQDRLKELFDYCQQTGVFTRKKLAGGQIPGSIAGRIGTSGYSDISVDGKRYRSHRLVWLYVYGYMPDCQIDHINLIKSDNRLANLRLATHKQNMENMPVYKSNSSGYVGIDKMFGKWRARIGHHGKVIHLGMFDSIEEAVGARNSAQKELHTHAPKL